MSDHFDRKPEPSTNKDYAAAPLDAAANSEFWLENSGTTPRWDNGRTAAYLAAYVFWCGPNLPSSIHVHEGFVHPDRAVMRSLIRARCVEPDGGVFRLTEKGQALIAPFVTLSPSEMAS
jgi:hypothetical protein